MDKHNYNPIESILNSSKHFNNLIENNTTNTPSFIPALNDQITNDIKIEINKEINEAENIIEKEVEKEVENVKNIVKNKVEKEVENKVENVKNIVKNKVEKEVENVKNIVENKVENVKNIVEKEAEKVKSKFENIQNGIQASLNYFQNGKKQIEEQFKENNNKYSPQIEINNYTPDNSESGSTIVTTTRNRKTDRKNLANDILAELPISFRINDSILIDSHETPENYVNDWNNWVSGGQNQLDILIEQINVFEQKYKSLAKFNNNSARTIQFCLLALGSAVVYIQASGGNSDVVNKFTIASGAGTTIASSLLTFCGFAKKGPHYSKVVSNLKRLKSWIESKLVLPISKRFSPYDIYTISKKAFDTIIFEAKEGLQDQR
jgi:hypothetical protein